MSEPLSTRVLLGVTGGIAAYKSPDLVRRMRERAADVRVVMTRSACSFVTPLTFQAVSGNSVHTELLDERAEAAMGHIELARWADVVLVAPASAGFIGRLANGLADDLLTTLCLATDAAIHIAPAMNARMWRAESVRDNVDVLRARAVRVLGPGDGDQACGDVGEGRMLEPAELAEALLGSRDEGVLAGLSVVVTAGPTREPIDPVRYLSNHSSGKMGYAVAAAARDAGARVTLVSGPTALAAPWGVTALGVETAAQMHDAVMGCIDSHEMFIGAAAVADFRPAAYVGRKIKKDGAERTLELAPTQDILSDVAALEPRPFTVGFAAETHDVERNARAKLRRKRLDVIAANRVGIEGTGFGANENAMTLFWEKGRADLELAPKPEIARRLIRVVAEHYRAKHKAQDS